LGLLAEGQERFNIDIQDTLVQNSAQHQKMIQFFKAVKAYQNDTGDFEYNAKRYLSYASSGLNWAQGNGSEMDILEAKFYKLRYSFDVGNYDDGFVLANELLASQTFQEDKRITRVTSYVKNMYLKLNAYTQLLAFYPTYNQMNRKHGRTISKSDYINDTYLARAYYDQRNYMHAIGYFKKAAITAVKNNNQRWASTLYNDVGLCFKHLRKWDSANVYFDEASRQIKFLQQRTDKKKDREYMGYFEYIIQSNKADYYVYLGEPSKALPFYMKELEESKKRKEKLIITSAHYNIALVHYLKENYRDAQLHLDSVLMFDKRFNEYTLKTLTLRAQCYAGQGQMKIANTYFRKAADMRDSLDLSRVENNYVAASTQYDLARKESDLTLSAQQVESEKQRNRFFLLGLCIVGVLALLLFVYYRKAKRDKTVIAAQKTKAERDAQEKSLLLKEVHHRVKNNLQVISGLLDLQRAKKEASFENLVDDTQKYIHSMSLVHEMLYQKDQLMRVNMQEYFSKLATFSASGQLKKNVDINVHAEGAELQLDKSTPLGLILTELISNSYKHGFKKEDEGRINIRLEAKENEYQFTYADNGVGLPENFSAATTRSLGFRLIRMFAEEMNAKMEIEDEGNFLLNLSLPK